MRAGLANAFSTRCLIFDKIPPDVGIITISTVFNKYKKQAHKFVKNTENCAFIDMFIFPQYFQLWHTKSPEILQKSVENLFKKSSQQFSTKPTAPTTTTKI